MTLMGKTDLIALLLEVLRSRTGKWDVIKAAIGNTGDTVRLIAVILAMTLSPAATAAFIYLLACR
jgi:hypothetical protein